MLELYPLARGVHLAAVLASGALFAARGLAGLAGWPHAMHPALRYLSYAIDLVLLGAGLSLVALLRGAPLATAWLLAKLVLLAVYIVLGSLALKRGRTPRARRLALLGAVALYLFIVSIARAHDPLGVFARLAG